MVCSWKFVKFQNVLGKGILFPVLTIFGIFNDILSPLGKKRKYRIILSMPVTKFWADVFLNNTLNFLHNYIRIAESINALWIDCIYISCAKRNRRIPWTKCPEQMCFYFTMFLQAVLIRSDATPEKPTSCVFDTSNSLSNYSNPWNSFYINNIPLRSYWTRVYAQVIQQLPHWKPGFEARMLKLTRLGRKSPLSSSSKL